MKVSKNTIIVKVLENCPEAGKIMQEYGLHCVYCHVASSESIENGAKMHGLSDKEIDEMINKINNLLEKQS